MARARALQAVLLATTAASTTVGFLACLDATPVTISPPDASSMSADVSADAIVDASRDRLEAEVESGPTPCVKCLETPDNPGPGCGDELAACMQNTECAQALDCAIAKGCFDRGSSSALISCGYPCAQEAGIVTLTDPAITLAYNVFTCAAKGCESACQLGAD